MAGVQGRLGVAIQGRGAAVEGRGRGGEGGKGGEGGGERGGGEVTDDELLLSDDNSQVGRPFLRRFARWGLAPPPFSADHQKMTVAHRL